MYGFNDDGTVDYYSIEYTDELYYIESYKYHIEDDVLYMDINVGSTTCYVISFSGKTRLVVQEGSQGVLTGDKYLWTRLTDVVEIERETTTAIEEKTDPADLFTGSDTLIYHPEAILGYWHYIQSEDSVLCFNADGTVDKYERYRGEDEFTHIGNYDYHIEGKSLYIEDNIGSTTSYEITFEGPSLILAQEYSQGVWVYDFEWVRGSEIEE